MKEFNLKEAKAGKPVCTRGGLPVRIICWDRLSDYPIVALVKNPNQAHENTLSYRLDGKYFKCEEKDKRDLMMASEKKEGWINMFNAGCSTSYTGNTIYETEETARTYGVRSGFYVTTIKIEWWE